MKKIIVTPLKHIRGTIEIPPDKSISHRAVMLASISNGTTRIKNFLKAQDCLQTVNAFKAMGVEINEKAKSSVACDLEIIGKGLRGLEKPKQKLFLGNSGTTMRLLSGILTGQNFETSLSGDESLSNRPMKRIVEPLCMMGAKISGKSSNSEIYPPLVIDGAKLTPIDYRTKVASAQVKSCILLAGLYADGITTVAEPFKSRDHTEKMLDTFGAEVNIEGLSVSVAGNPKLNSHDLLIPSDISSAAFFLVASLLVPNSSLTIKAVGINPTRSGALEILKRMGAKIELRNEKDEFEPIADLYVDSSPLKAITIERDLIPQVIDELPVIMVAATQAEGTTQIKGASELRVKETDRISSMSAGLGKMGADIRFKADTIFIKGPTKLKGAKVSSFKDHRTAMSLAIAGLCAEGETVIEDTECILTSFSNFEEILKSL